MILIWKIWYAKNNLQSGDPATGSSNTFTTGRTLFVEVFTVMFQVQSLILNFGQEHLFIPHPQDIKINSANLPT